MDQIIYMRRRGAYGYTRGEAGNGEDTQKVIPLSVILGEKLKKRHLAGIKPCPHNF